jgi:predicted RNase H-like HicB family nuclease
MMAPPGIARKSLGFQRSVLETAGRIGAILVLSPMHNEFTAVFERDGDWYLAYSPEIPGANGQGRTKEEARNSLVQAIALILEDRREEGLRGVPPDAERETVIVR